jgi:hypothetical protein
MIGRRLMVLIVGAILLWPSPALAVDDEYAPPPADVTVSAGTVSSGGSVTIRGQVAPFDTVTLMARFADGTTKVVATTTADENGFFSVAVTLGQAGLATVTASGSPSGQTATVSVRVLAAGGGLPVTGTDGSQLGTALAVGAGGVAVGTLLVWMAFVWRRRAREV